MINVTEKSSDKSTIRHFIEAAEFWLDRVKTQEELLGGELIKPETRHEVAQDLGRYVRNLYDVSVKLNQAVGNVE